MKNAIDTSQVMSNSSAVQVTTTTAAEAQNEAAGREIQNFNEKSVNGVSKGYATPDGESSPLDDSGIVKADESNNIISIINDFLKKISDHLLNMLSEEIHGDIEQPFLLNFESDVLVADTNGVSAIDKLDSEQVPETVMIQ